MLDVGHESQELAGVVGDVVAHVHDSTSAWSSAACSRSIRTRSSLMIAAISDLISSVLMAFLQS
jgi:hypothetical protein